MPLDLRDRIHRNRDDDQETRAAEVEGHRKTRDQNFRQQRDRNKVQAAEHRQTRENEVQVVRRVRARRMP